MPRTLFEILWYSGGPDHAPNRCIGRDYIRRHDLTDAIARACVLLRSGKASDGYAVGMYVRKAADQDRTATQR